MLDKQTCARARFDPGTHVYAVLGIKYREGKKVSRGRLS